MADRLERHYRRLLFAYPAEYRTRRADEIVATLLDLARPEQRLPSFADAADLIGNGLRRRLDTAAIAGFEAGLGLAAPFALAIAAGISAYAWWRVEPVRADVYSGGAALFGQFRTLGPIAYAAWLLAAAARSVLRPAAGRVVIATAIAVTLLVPVVAPLTAVDRPPLWVLMALTVFGLLALAGTATALGTARPSADERLAVPAGAVAVAATASTAVLVWPPASMGFGYYYQPTIARVGTVVAATVATVAAVAIVRMVRRRPARDWLWAACLLGLPAGWLGPFDSARLRVAADQDVPHFGRLAQVLLATCLAAVTMMWLVRRTAVAGGAVTSGQGAGRALSWAGAAALGSLAGLVAFVGIGGLGLVGFHDAPIRHGVPGHVLAAGVALLLAGGLAVLAVPLRPRASTVGWGALSGLAAAYCVAAYDNGWTAGGWSDFGHSLALVATVAFIPHSWLVLAALAVLPSRAPQSAAAGTRRGSPRTWAAGGVVAVSLGWLGYATLPYLLSWGPVLLVLLACCAVLPFIGRRSITGGR